MHWIFGAPNYYGTINALGHSFLKRTFSLLLIRYGTVRLVTNNSPLRKENSVMSVVLTRGLFAAILATIPMLYGLLYSELFLNVALIVIITTAIFSTIGVLVLSRKKLGNRRIDRSV